MPSQMFLTLLAAMSHTLNEAYYAKTINCESIKMSSFALHAQCEFALMHVALEQNSRSRTNLKIWHYAPSLLCDIALFIMANSILRLPGMDVGQENV